MLGFPLVESLVCGFCLRSRKTFGKWNSVVPQQAGRHLFTVSDCPVSTFLGTIPAPRKTCPVLPGIAFDRVNPLMGGRVVPLPVVFRRVRRTLGNDDKII